MARELRPIDVTAIPELLRLAEEVGASGEGRLLRRDQEDLAVLIPARSNARRRARGVKTQADLDALRAAAGSWRDVDTDKLVAEINESRRSSRPPVEL